MWDTLLEKNIQHELNKLDPDLFLDKEYFEGSVYPVVKYRSGEQILNVATWPYLSMDIVNLVHSQEGSITEAIARVKANNAAKKEIARQETLLAMDEGAREHNRSTGKIRRWYIKGVKPIS